MGSLNQLDKYQSLYRNTLNLLSSKYTHKLSLFNNKTMSQEMGAVLDLVVTMDPQLICQLDRAHLEKEIQLRGWPLSDLTQMNFYRFSHLNKQMGNVGVELKLHLLILQLQWLRIQITTTIIYRILLLLLRVYMLLTLSECHLNIWVTHLSLRKMKIILRKLKNIKRKRMALALKASLKKVHQLQLYAKQITSTKQKEQAKLSLNSF